MPDDADIDFDEYNEYAEEIATIRDQADELLARVEDLEARKRTEQLATERRDRKRELRARDLERQARAAGYRADRLQEALDGVVSQRNRFRLQDPRHSERRIAPYLRN